MKKMIGETEFGKKQITAIELVNSIIDDKQMSIRKSFEYGMQVLSVREGYATIIGVKNTEGECRIFCEWLNPDEWQNGKSKMSINEFKQAILRAKITETMPVVFVIDGKEYNSISKTAIDNGHKQFRIWINMDDNINEDIETDRQTLLKTKIHSVDDCIQLMNKISTYMNNPTTSPTYGFELSPQDKRRINELIEDISVELNTLSNKESRIIRSEY